MAKRLIQITAAVLPQVPVNSAEPAYHETVLFGLYDDGSVYELVSGAKVHPQTTMDEAEREWHEAEFPQAHAGTLSVRDAIEPPPEFPQALAETIAAPAAPVPTPAGPAAEPAA